MKARLDGGTRAMLIVDGDGSVTGIDRIGPLGVQSGSFTPFTFRVGGRKLPRVTGSCIISSAATGRPGVAVTSVASRRRSGTLKVTFNGGIISNCRGIVGTLAGKCAAVNFTENEAIVSGLLAFLLGDGLIIGYNGGRCYEVGSCPSLPLLRRRRIGG